jgi:beta-mannanase
VTGNITFGGENAHASMLGGSVALGAYIAGAPWEPTKLDEFSSIVGAPPSVVMWYQDWAHDGVKEFDPRKMDAVVSRGAMPMVTWEPWDHTRGVNQPDYSLRSIDAGKHDALIKQWARDAAAWGKPFYLRFAHEMNGHWNSWSPGVNGNTVSQYVSAWRRVRGIFGQEGAENVRWVWSPNVEYDGSVPFDKVYPGDSHIDWLGIDGYNWGTTQSWSNWTALAEVFGPSYAKLASMANKPMMVAETASTELGGGKAAWIRQGFLNDVPSRFPRIRAVVWFNENKETDWRVDSSLASLTAYQEVAASSSYQAQLP